MGRSQLCLMGWCTSSRFFYTNNNHLYLTATQAYLLRAFTQLADRNYINPCHQAPFIHQTKAYRRYGNSTSNPQSSSTMTITKALFVAVLVCASFCSTVLAARELSDDSAMAARHEQWMVQFRRVYKDAAEKARRFEVFKTNVKFIESFDAEKRKFWLGVNQFADLSNDEFRATKTNKGFKPSTVMVPTGFRYENICIDTLAESVDWRTKGAVTSIKDQGQCGNVYLGYITTHIFKHLILCHVI
jgi:hypothetical protein